jgi:hypothetical protein
MEMHMREDAAHQCQAHAAFFASTGVSLGSGFLL